MNYQPKKVSTMQDLIKLRRFRVEKFPVVQRTLLAKNLLPLYRDTRPTRFPASDGEGFPPPTFESERATYPPINRGPAYV